MWYAMQVFSGQEQILKLWIDRMSLARECFIPVRELKKKYHGSWNTVKEKVFPGYVFVVTDHAMEMQGKLKEVPRFARILGATENGFIPLSEDEIRFISRFGGEDHVSHLSRVTVEEGNHVKILDGDLMNYEGDIVKVNLHKRIAIVRVPFMGGTADIHLGIDIVEKTDKL